jgi:hypothetical protein
MWIDPIRATRVPVGAFPDADPEGMLCPSHK